MKKLKIKFVLIDDDGKEFSGEVDLKPSKSSIRSETPTEKKYSGLKGGIEFLMDNQFLEKLKSSKEVFSGLKNENYFHSLQSVDRRLRILVSKKNSITY